MSAIPLSRRAALLGLGACAMPMVGLRAQGLGDWPNRPIRWVNPGPAGGAGDVISRLIADRLQAKLGQPIVVDNRPGAGTNIGMTQVARAAPDGYTVGLASIAANAANKWLYRNMPFDPEKDFAAVGLIALVPNIVVIPPSVPARTLQEFITWAKAQNRPINFGSVGAGSSQHLAGSQFQIITGVPLQHLPYTNGGQMNSDLIEGRLDLLFQSISAVTQMAQAGRMRPLAVSGAARVEAFPDLPTMQEQGVDITSTGWFGLCTPAGVPEPILAKLDTELQEIVQDPALAQRLSAGGAIPRAMGRADFARFMAEESAKWRVVIQAVGASVD
ncbi:Bug family tripartite tricarboxylate transporter substrate binding protein [Falsiroseomonas tokyonensis]|uniref:Bug family tripartite tricarboxylate transporter substrate binding protein n=1 Tax=Falsiroseomonas tokyonensis TaxID=430521 RepID=A0ABV7BL30_9PROT|nr:tripartite tricarboxylate transporter substrate binding protein [Falsiroseomonas tokyonensis]MBU8536282.1 tripartite tricarboxylate transporter substrate binding protein [Falsiroseomonas tokyonensis]